MRLYLNMHVILSMYMYVQATQKLRKTVQKGPTKPDHAKQDHAPWPWPDITLKPQPLTCTVTDTASIK